MKFDDPLGSIWNPYPNWESVPPELKTKTKRFVVNPPYDLIPVRMTKDELEAINFYVNADASAQLMMVNRTYRHCYSCSRRRRFIAYEYNFEFKHMNYALCNFCGSRQDHAAKEVVIDEDEKIKNVKQACLDWKFPYDGYLGAFCNTITNHLDYSTYCWNLMNEIPCGCAQCLDEDLVDSVLARYWRIKQ